MQGRMVEVSVTRIRYNEGRRSPYSAATATKQVASFMFYDRFEWGRGESSISACNTRLSRNIALDDLFAIKPRPNQIVHEGREQTAQATEDDAIANLREDGEPDSDTHADAEGR